MSIDKSLIDSMTFADAARAGHITAADLDDYIDRWHDTPALDGTVLHEYLGLTWQQYAHLIETGELNL